MRRKPLCLLRRWTETYPSVSSLPAKILEPVFEKGKRIRQYYHSTHACVHPFIHPSVDTYHTYIHDPYMHACIHTFIHRYIHHTYVHTNTSINTCTHACIHRNINTYHIATIHNYPYIADDCGASSAILITFEEVPQPREAAST